VHGDDALEKERVKGLVRELCLLVHVDGRLFGHVYERVLFRFVRLQLVVEQLDLLLEGLDLLLCCGTMWTGWSTDAFFIGRQVLCQARLLALDLFHLVVQRLYLVADAVALEVSSL